MTPGYAVECPYRHYEEPMRPRSHAVAAIKAASTLVKLPQYQDVMDHRWLGKVRHLGTWRAQHTGVIKRVSLAGHAEQLKQENLFPPRMHARPDRERNKPYQPSQSMPQNVSRMRHDRPLHGQLSQAHRRPTVPGEATENNRSRQ